MDLVPVADVVVLPPGVAGAVPGERQGDGFENDVVEADLAFVAELLVERLARFGRPLHVHFTRQEEVGDGPERRRESFRDRLPDLRERYVLVRATCDRDGGAGSGERSQRLGRYRR